LQLSTDAQMSSRPNPKVAQAATIADALPARGLVLLGVFQRAAGNVALVRQASGRLGSLRVGDRLGAARVIAIGDEGLRLEIDGTAMLLTIPGGPGGA
jgi:hypothetical protein